MTALTALERLPLNAKVPISARAASVPNMNIGAKPGQVWTLKQLLHALLLISGNDAAYAIAERTAGTVEAFATLMNRTGAQLGLRDSTFSDPAGLDGREGLNGGSHVSAYDLAVIARNALATPEIASVVRLVDYDFVGPDRAHHLENHNAKFLAEYAGATGMKTGYTTRAQNSLVASATRNGRTIVAVLLGSYGGELGTRHWAEAYLDQAFRTPRNTKGTGDVLPPVRISTADARARLLSTLARPLGTPPAATPATAAKPALTTASSSPSTKPPRSEPSVRVDGERASARSAATRGDGGSASTSWYLAAAVIAAFAVALVARRRAVVRRRARIRRRYQPPGV
jgi:D-alanyl-D-alanine carboxypeptidase (penicillin-binding protein 5/6)